MNVTTDILFDWKLIVALDTRVQLYASAIVSLSVKLNEITFHFIVNPNCDKYSKLIVPNLKQTFNDVWKNNQSTEKLFLTARYFLIFFMFLKILGGEYSWSKNSAEETILIPTGITETQSENIL